MRRCYGKIIAHFHVLVEILSRVSTYPRFREYIYGLGGAVKPLPRVLVRPEAHHRAVIYVPTVTNPCWIMGPAAWVIWRTRNLKMKKYIAKPCVWLRDVVVPPSCLSPLRLAHVLSPPPPPWHSEPTPAQFCHLSVSELSSPLVYDSTEIYCNKVPMDFWLYHSVQVFTCQPLSLNYQLITYDMSRRLAKG